MTDAIELDPPTAAGLIDGESTCPECGEVFTASGKDLRTATLFANRKRSNHRKQVHGYVPPPKPPPTGRKPGRPRKDGSPLQIVETIGDAGKPRGAAARQAPKRGEWEKKVSMTLGIVATWRTVRVVNSSRLPDEAKDEAVDRLTMSEDETDAVAAPFASVVAEGPLAALNKKYGRQALDVLDLLPALVAIVSFESRIRDFNRQYGNPPAPRQPRGRREAPANGSRPVASDAAPEEGAWTPHVPDGVVAYGPGVS